MLIKKLKDYIELTGLKKKKIAEKLQISTVHLSYILNGKKEPGIDLENRIRELIK